MGLFDLFMTYRCHVYRKTVAQTNNGVWDGETWARVGTALSCKKEPLPSTLAATLAGRMEADNIFSMDLWRFEEHADVRAGDVLKNVSTRDDGTPTEEFAQYWTVRGNAKAYNGTGMFAGFGRKLFLASKEGTGPFGTALVQGLAGAWSFNETGGATRADWTDAARDLSQVGLAGATANAVLGARAGEFAGAGGWEREHEDAFATGSANSFSQLAWVRILDKGEVRPIAAKWHGVPQWCGWTQEYDPITDRIRFRVSEDGTDDTYHTVVADNLGSPNPGQYYLVGSGYDADANRIWIQIALRNGVVLPRTYTTGVPEVFDNDQVAYRIGMNSDDSPACFLGYIDEASYHQRTVTEGEFEILANDGDGLEYPYL